MKQLPWELRMIHRSAVVLFNFLLFVQGLAACGSGQPATSCEIVSTSSGAGFCQCSTSLQHEQNGTRCSVESESVRQGKAVNCCYGVRQVGDRSSDAYCGCSATACNPQSEIPVADCRAASESYGFRTGASGAGGGSAGGRSNPAGGTPSTGSGPSGTGGGVSGTGGGTNNAAGGSSAGPQCSPGFGDCKNCRCGQSCFRASVASTATPRCGYRCSSEPDEAIHPGFRTRHTRP